MSTKRAQTNRAGRANLHERTAALEMRPDEFRAAGHALIDRVADFLAALPTRRVTPGETPQEVQVLLGDSHLPEQGADASSLLDEVADLLFAHSLFNGHPRFWGFITSSAAPIGALADLLAAAVNPNVGAWALAPMATEIETQTVRWIAELIGFPVECGGLLVSGGNMANLTCFLTGLRAQAGWDVRTRGVGVAGRGAPRVYASAEAHTWLQKAADLSGLGTDAVRWIPTDSTLRLDVAALRAQIERDTVAGDVPLMVIGTAGTVSTGAVDPLPEIASVCREHNLWLHVDGAYGAFASVLLDETEGDTGDAQVPQDLRGLAEADSVAVDPHKWLYAPLEAGCALVRDAALLRRAFSFHPPYYHLDESQLPLNYHEYGPQNSRGFRALKVWLGLRQAGRAGYRRMIADDIRLARALFDQVAATPELEPLTCDLSIATFRYVPPDLAPGDAHEEYLNQLNARLVEVLQGGGEVFLSNAVIHERFALRACIVNFRTRLEDVEALPELVVRRGRQMDASLRGAR